MSDVVVIPCAGNGDRWHNYRGCFKQHVKVDGEPLLRRTVRMVRERLPGVPIYVVSHIKRMGVPGAEVVEPDRVEQTRDVDKYTCGRRFWSEDGTTWILLGDVYFSEVALDKMLRRDAWNCHWVGRSKASSITGKKWGELFGVAIRGEGKEALLAACDAVRDEPGAGGWAIYRFQRDRGLCELSEVDDYTEDFDTPNDYVKWCSQREAERRRLIANPPAEKPPIPSGRVVHRWLRREFRNADRKVFLELGANVGQDTELLCQVPSVHVYALEPDPRNAIPQLPNVTVLREAVSNEDGRAEFVLSQALPCGVRWTKASSLHRPKLHKAKFGRSILVKTTTLDRLCERFGIRQVDFIWADVQGAEREMILGGREALRRTRYLYTEYSDSEQYEGQIDLAGILELLPGWDLVRRWPREVLLKNREL